MSNVNQWQNLSPVAKVDPYHYGNLIWTVTLRYSGLPIPGTRQDEFVGYLSIFTSFE